MTNARRAVALALLALAAGCATFPVAPPEMDFAAKQFGPPAPGQATLYVYRNESFGGAVSMPLVLDGAQVTSTGPRSFVWLTVAPGPHRIISKAENDEVLDVVAEPGRSYFVWQEVKMGILMARSKLQLVDEGTGRAGVMECSLIDTRVPAAVPAAAQAPASFAQ